MVICDDNLWQTIYGFFCSWWMSLFNIKSNRLQMCQSSLKRVSRDRVLLLTNVTFHIKTNKQEKESNSNSITFLNGSYVCQTNHYILFIIVMSELKLKVKTVTGCYSSLLKVSGQSHNLPSNEHLLILKYQKRQQVKNVKLANTKLPLHFTF